MTLIDTTADVRVERSGPSLRLRVHDREAELHPMWLRDRSTEPGQIEATNRQRLFTPFDIPADLAVIGAEVTGRTLIVDFSDGHRARLDLDTIERDLGWIPDPEAPPTAQPWTTPLEPFPYVDWSGIGWSADEEDVDAVLAFLETFYRYGYVVFRNTGVQDGTVLRVADRIGYVSGQNFGWMFDVRSTPNPTDLAYTSFGLLAHTDEPYRIEPPGIQLLHCIVNDAPGGDSTLTDGLAAACALRSAHPDWFRALVETEVDYRYDMGSDTVVNTGHVLEYDRNGRYRGIRLNSKLDVPLPRPGTDLDAWYAGRRWLTEWCNDPAHQARFGLAPGDLMFMDNHRALHGRTAFDPSRGPRHLQGCYIEHNGPDTMYRLARRRSSRTPGATP